MIASRAGVASVALIPARLLHSHRPHDIFVDAPLARGPLNDLGCIACVEAVRQPVIGGGVGPVT